MIGLMWRSVDHPGKLIFSPDLSLSRYHHHQGTSDFYERAVSVLVGIS